MVGIKTVFVIILVFQLKNFKWQTQALTCLQCREIFQPRHCHVVVQCTQDEYCAVERALNTQDEIVYNIGCRARDLCEHQTPSYNGSRNNACFECCKTDLCNAQACGEHGYPTDRGPVCSSCKPSADLTTCRTVQVCQGHEVCFTDKDTEFSDTIYTSGCRDKHICYNRRSFSGPDEVRLKKFILSGNHEKECCTVDLCNVKERTVIPYKTTWSSTSTLHTTTKLTATSTYGPDTLYNNTISTHTERITIPYKTTWSNPSTLHTTTKLTATSTFGPDTLYNTTSSTHTERKTIHYKTSWSNPSTLSKVANVTATVGPDTLYTPTSSMQTGIPVMSCLEILRANPNSKSGVYKIMLVGSNKSLDVFCDMDTDGGGWIVFQRRIDASVDFKRTFSEYEAGFGSLTGNLWLGLRSLHTLTNENTILRVDVTTARDATYYATYSQFYIDGAPRYIAHCRGYSGTAGDALNSVSTINNMVFTTVDRDANINCATDYHGGWWYHSCYGANLNGQYGTPGSMSYIFIIWYQGFLIQEGSMKFVEMKLR